MDEPNENGLPSDEPVLLLSNLGTKPLPEDGGVEVELGAAGLKPAKLAGAAGIENEGAGFGGSADFIS